MRILSVEVEGFGPFKTRQRVDFDAFAADGIFLIGGRTGAGKTSILDAVCFALYGSAPRYGGGSQRLRSDHVGPGEVTSVTLEFEVNGTTYRITRTPEYERPKERGTGMTLQKASAQLYVQHTDGEWEGIAARPVDVAGQVERIVQLKADQFLQVILLAQNRFHEFLLAESEDRRKLLRTLFGTRRFEEYDQQLQERRREVDERFQAASGSLDERVAQLSELVVEPAPSQTSLLGEWADAGVAALVTVAAESDRALKAAVAAAVAATDAHEAAAQLAERQRRRADAESRLAGAEARVRDLAPMRDELDAAERAAAVAPFRTESLKTREAAEAAQRALDDELASYPGDPASDLDEVLSDADRRLGELAPLVELEGRLDELAARAAAADTALAAHDEKVAGYEPQLAEIAARRSTLDIELQAARDAAAPGEAARAAVAAARDALDAAEKAEAHAAELDTARLAAAEAADARATAAEHAAAIRRRRVDGQAAVLAHHLVPGDPCPVCGSAEHPAPAAWDGEPVSDDDVAAAEAALEAAGARVTASDQEVARIQVQIASFEGLAQGKRAEALRAELADAQQRVENTRQAEATVTELSRERTELDQRETQIREAQSAAASHRDALVLEQATAVAAHSDALSRLTAARGEAAQLADIVAQLGALKTATQRVIAARTRLRETLSAADTSAETYAEQRSAHRFDDDSAVEAATRSGTERARMRTEIENADRELATLRGILAEPELQRLPTEPVDLTELTAQRDAAVAARDRANTAHALHADAAGRATQIAARLHTELTAIGDLAARADTIRRLAATVRGLPPNTYGMKLEAFVLAAELEQIVAAANTRLASMSAGRYLLEHSDQRDQKRGQAGLDLAIVDQHTGIARPPRSLSGGETFLASLALALGLAEVVTARAGGIRLDTLFIDEGFGSLDADTLEVAMHTLDSLRQGGRTIGLISHVEAMKEQIPSQLHVDVADGGWSVIRQSA